MSFGSAFGAFGSGAVDEVSAVAATIPADMALAVTDSNLKSRQEAKSLSGQVLKIVRTTGRVSGHAGPPSAGV